jgi:hypothetical protein
MTRKECGENQRRSTQITPARRSAQNKTAAQMNLLGRADLG